MCGGYKHGTYGMPSNPTKQPGRRLQSEVAAWWPRGVLSCQHYIRMLSGITEMRDDRTCGGANTSTVAARELRRREFWMEEGQLQKVWRGRRG